MAKRKPPRKSTVGMLPTSLCKEARSVVKNRYKLLQTLPDGMDYQTQETLIDTLFHKTLPNNKDIHEVTTKLVALNAFYSVHLQGIPAMAQSIVRHLLTFDIDVRSGSIQLVNTLAKSGNGKKTYRSFATKYCACHNPQDYPIYDSIVREFLINVICKGNLPPFRGTKDYIRNFIDRDYQNYIQIYDAFRNKYKLQTLSYRQIDWYIWVTHKCKKSAHLSKYKIFLLTK